MHTTPRQVISSSTDCRPPRPPQEKVLASKLLCRRDRPVTTTASEGSTNDGATSQVGAIQPTPATAAATAEVETIDTKHKQAATSATGKEGRDGAGGVSLGGTVVEREGGCSELEGLVDDEEVRIVAVDLQEMAPVDGVKQLQVCPSFKRLSASIGWCSAGPTVVLRFFLRCTVRIARASCCAFCV